MSVKTITQGRSYKNLPVYMNALEKYYKNMTVKTLVCVSSVCKQFSNKLESWT